MLKLMVFTLIQAQTQGFTEDTKCEHEYNVDIVFKFGIDTWKDQIL